MSETERLERILLIADDINKRVKVLGEAMIDIQKRHIELMLRVDTLERR
jgi:hypothetical protein